MPKQINLFLVHKISHEFVRWMLEKVTNGDLQRWLAEDALSQRKRKELNTKLSQFEEAIVILKSAGSGSK